MAKSKNTKVFRLQDSRSVVFSKAEFELAVNEKAREINHRNGKERGGKQIVFKMIAERLSSSDDPIIIENEIRVVKNWYFGNNGPSNLEDIYTLAEVLGYEDKEAFLRETKDVKEDNNMFASAPEMVNVKFDQRRVMAVMKEMKEKDVAFELYSTFVDLLGEYLKADWDVWFEYKAGTPEWQGALANFPRRMPVKCAIHKAKMYLSEETISRAYNLLETMFGPQQYEDEEPCELKYDINFFFSGFLHERLELFDNYLENHGIEKTEDGFEQGSEVWYDFIYELNGDWWQRLEEVFEDYFP